MTTEKPPTETEVKTAAKVIDLMVALRQSLRGLPVDGDPAKKAELDAAENARAALVARIAPWNTPGDKHEPV